MRGGSVYLRIVAAGAGVAGPVLRGERAVRVGVVVVLRIVGRACCGGGGVVGGAVRITHYCGLLWELRCLM